MGSSREIERRLTWEDGKAGRRCRLRDQLEFGVLGEGGKGTGFGMLYEGKGVSGHPRGECMDSRSIKMVQLATGEKK
jgi:hypothetical protein